MNARTQTAQELAGLPLALRMELKTAPRTVKLAAQSSLKLKGLRAPRRRFSLTASRTPRRIDALTTTTAATDKEKSTVSSSFILDSC
jgi:hypothetical protein